ncbi:MAG: GntR family transcriptional regulator [Butyrivibrio sp.]
MYFTIDFDSNEAIYLQLCNQIIFHIATEQIKEGESLPSVRQLADTIGINMHTVNKAYAVLREQGYITLDRRHGAVIAVDVNKLEALNELAQSLRAVIARAMCRNLSSEEIHMLVDDIIKEFDTGL